MQQPRTGTVKDPFDLFDEWYRAALQSDVVPDRNAMTLATATPDGKPSARMVLLKQYDREGFVFFTNYESRKGIELAENPFAALILYWPEQRRQIRIQGSVVRVAVTESDAYFASRPRGSQVAARASRQSSVIPDRASLEARVREIDGEFEGASVPRPEFWGGYRVNPECIEFWEGRIDRLHDRILYTRRPNGEWSADRLSP